MINFILSRIYALISITIGFHGPSHWFGMIRAWKKIYGSIGWKDVVAIILHDIGYIQTGTSNNDSHPKLGAWIGKHLLGNEYEYLIAGHSRRLCKLEGYKPSKLCLVDKSWCLFVPEWIVRIIHFIDIGLDDPVDKILEIDRAYYNKHYKVV